MFSLRNLIRLLRPQQWYKNLLVFAAVFFSGSLFDTTAFALSLYGFVALCLISSGNYAVNDILDYRRDLANPEKKKRPIASGKIGRKLGAAIALALYGLGFSLSWMLGANFMLICATLAILSFLYSVCLKHIQFVDIILISSLFVLRAIGGVVLLEVELSPWFLLSILFLAFFLVAGKRYGDLVFLQERAGEHKPVLEAYDTELLKGMLLVFISCLLVIFGLYAYFTGRMILMILYPVLIYVLFRYLHLVTAGSPIVRNPERALTDRPLLVAMAIFALGLFLAIYFA